MIAVMLSSFMAALASCFNSCSTLFTIDVYAYLRPGQTEAQLVRAGRAFTVLLACVSLAWLPVIENSDDQLFLYIQGMQTIWSAPVVTVFLAAVASDALSEWTAWWSLVVGLAVGFLAWLLRETLPTCTGGPLCWTLRLNILHFSIALLILNVFVLLVLHLAVDGRLLASSEQQQQQQQQEQHYQQIAARPVRAPRRAGGPSVSFAVQSKAAQGRLPPRQEERSPPPVEDGPTCATAVGNFPPSPLPEVCSEGPTDATRMSPPLLEDVWVPEWASCELHERALDELQVVEAMFPDECRILTPEVRAHLEDCITRRTVSVRPEPLRLELAQRLLGAEESVGLIVDFAFPPFYPTHPALVELRIEGDSGMGPTRHGFLERLEAQLCSKVLRELQGGEAVLAVVEWLAAHGAAELAGFEAAAAAPSPLTPPEGVVTALAPSEFAAPSLVSSSKHERIEQARAERLADKYSQSWDLCYAFVKHGTCKDKDCKWRHAAPGKDKKEAGDPVATAAAAASAAATGAPMPKTGRSAKRKMPKKD